MSLHLPKHLPKLERRPELDALRGLFLVWMTLTHLPTRFADFVNQPIGYVSSAEGFVFLSALLVGRLYIRDLIKNEAGVRAKLWMRSLKVYGYHLLMLTFAFTIAAALAVHTHKAALTNLLDFYLAHPVEAIVGSVLLIYCPPLLDILPMYVTFLFFSPLLLSISARWRWRPILLVSGLIWLAAQFGLREAAHNAIVGVTHLHIPLQETGAFNMFSWQAVWVAGLFLGAKSATGAMPLKRLPGWAFAAAVPVCLFFIGVRHNWLGPHLTAQTLGLSLDKWSIGWLRVINLISFTMVFYWLRRYVVKAVSIEPFLTLGKASLQVFCAHLFFVFVGLTLLYGEVEQLHGLTAIALVAITFAALIWVASNEVRKKRLERNRKRAEAEAETRQPIVPPATQTMAVAEQQP